MRIADSIRDDGRPSDAADAYAVVTRRYPASFAAWVQLGNMAKDAEDWPRAYEAYQRALVLHPDDGDAHIQLGHLEKMQGRRDEARSWYRQAVILDPNGAAANELAMLGERLEEMSSMHGEPSNGNLDIPARASIAYYKLQRSLEQRRA